MYRPPTPRPLYRRPEPPPDPETVYRGRCGTCGTQVEMLRYLTAAPLDEVGTMFAGQRSAECPLCGARVFLGATGEVRREVKPTPEPPAEKLKSAETPADAGDRPTTPDTAPGIAAKMLAALRRGEDLPLTPEDEAELERLDSASAAEEGSGDLLFGVDE